MTIFNGTETPKEKFLWYVGTFTPSIVIILVAIYANDIVGFFY